MNTCQQCSFREDNAFRLQPLQELDCPLFKFQHNGRCYCYCLLDIYKWIYGSEDPDANISNYRHPETNVEITQRTLDRLKEEYLKWYEENVEEQQFTSAELEDFRNGVDLFKRAYETRLNIRIPFEKAIDGYLEDLLEITPEEEQHLVALAQYIKEEYRNLGMI